MPDTYANYAALAANETENVDYRITTQDTPSNILVATPHGGGIEPGTSELVNAIAGSEYDSYLFEGIKSSGNSVLHITSTHFDEPRCVALNAKEANSIFIHGYSGSESIAYMGGLDEDLKSLIAAALTAAGFNVQVAPKEINASETNNICNRNANGKGVQLELTLGLRQSMFGNFSGATNRLATQNATFYSFVNAIRGVLVTLDTSNVPAQVIPKNDKSAEELYKRCAKYTGETDSISTNPNGTYTAETLTLFDGYRTSINRAKNRITQLKAASFKTEALTLNENKKFNTSILSKTFLSIKSLVDKNGMKVFWRQTQTGEFECPNNKQGEELTLTYRYRPADLPKLTDQNGMQDNTALASTLDFPAEIVDPFDLCFYAAVEYFTFPDTEDTERAQTYNAFWEEALSSIRTDRGQSQQGVKQGW